MLGLQMQIGRLPLSLRIKSSAKALVSVYVLGLCEKKGNYLPVSYRSKYADYEIIINY